MTALVCLWCRQPIRGRVHWWDSRPQCADPIACTRRIPATRKDRR